MYDPPGEKAMDALRPCLALGFLCPPGVLDLCLPLDLELDLERLSREVDLDRDGVLERENLRFCLA